MVLNPPSAGSHAAFAATLGSRSWNWLVGLCRALNVSVQLVDHRLAAILPFDGAEPDELTRLIVAGQPPLHAALSTAIHSRQMQFVTTGSLSLVCVPLASDSQVIGTLVIGRSAGTQSPDLGRARLERAASWLGTAAEAHLASQAAAAGNLLPLIRVLDGAVEHASDREIVSVFAEALAVWHDIEVVGYVETSPGVFVREVSLAGRPHSTRPLVLPPAAVPPPLQPTRMPRADIEGTSPAASQDVMVTTLSRRDVSTTWLLMLSGSLDACDTQLLSNYIAVLDVSISRAVEASKAAVTDALSGQLIAERGDVAAVTTAALEEVRRRLNTTSVFLSVETPRGVPVIRASSPSNAPGASPDVASTQKLTISRRTPGQYAMMLALFRADGPQFTPLEHQVAHAAASVLEFWAKRAASLPVVDDGAPGFGETIEHLAREALDRGTVVTAVVISARQPTGSTSPSEKWVEEIRRRMRQSDAVGMLPAGEIGLLLHDTTAAHAKAVTRRLQTALGGLGDTGSPTIRTIGFATRMPGQDAAEGILQDARLNAMTRSNGDSSPGVM